MRKTSLIVVIAALAALGQLTESGPMMLGSGDANAVIGRPLTPMSYAGVARRTTRRAAYYGGGYYGGYYGGGYGHGYAEAPVVSSTAVVTTLPSDCVQSSGGGDAYYQCGSEQYTPSYSGTTVVYRSM